MLSYLHMIFEVLSTLLLTPFIISSLGSAEYGVYKLIAAITSYLLLLDLGMGNSVVRYVAKFKENHDMESSRKYLGVCMVFYAAVSVAVLLLGGVLILSFQKIFATGLTAAEIALSKRLLLLTVLNAAVTLGTSVFYNILIAYSRFALSKGLSILQIIVRILVTAAALKLGYRSEAIVTINLVLTMLMRGYYVFYVLCVLKLRPQLRGTNAAFIKDIVSYSAFILLQMIATQINAQADQVLLGMFVTSSAVIIGIYGVGAQIVQYFQSVGQALGGVLMPGVVKLVESGAGSKELQNEMIRIGRYAFTMLGLIFVGFLVNGRSFIRLWAGAEYEQGYYVALMLMFAHMIIMTQSIGTQILWAKNKHQLQSVIKFVIVATNILLTIFLIRWDPLMGAAIGTVISLLLGDVLSMNIVFKKEIGISLKAYYTGLFKGILPCLLLSALAGSGVKLLPVSGLPGLILNVLVMTAVYAAAMWGFGFNESEKNMVRGLLCKLTNKQKKGRS